MEYYAKYDSPTGPLLLISDADALTGVFFGSEIPVQPVQLPVFDKAKQWLDGYFSGELRPIDFPVRVEGTRFQKLVWELLAEIPFGATRTYGDLAKQTALRMGKEKMSAQAVGQAVGANPISIIIPCHRVVGADRTLTGYAGGMENKVWLLRHEGWSVENHTIRKEKE